MGRLKFLSSYGYLQRTNPYLIKQLKCLDYVDDAIKDLIMRYLEEGAGPHPGGEKADSPNPEERDLYRLEEKKLSLEELDEMKFRLMRLARHMASLKSRRQKKANHGLVDLRRTMNKALLSGEIPSELKYRRRKPGKPSLVLLCDVSSSVLSFSEFMILFIYALQNRFYHVRSFLFVDLIDEVTEYLKNGEPEEAIGEAFSNARTSYGGITELGRVFAMFVREYLPSISRKSTLIILSDARNNGLPPEKKHLEIIKNHFKKVIWLNPQPREEWDKSDNIMSAYAPLCDQVFECRNLKQLEAVADAIL